MPEPEAAIGGGAPGTPPDRLGEWLLWGGRIFGFSVAAGLSVLTVLDPENFLNAPQWRWTDVAALLLVYCAGLAISRRFALAGGLMALAMAWFLLDAWRYFYQSWFSAVLSVPAVLVAVASTRRSRLWIEPMGRLLSVVLGPDIREGLRQGGRFLGTAGLAYFFLGFLPSYDRRLYVYDPAEAGVLFAAFAYVAGLLWGWAWPRVGGLAALAGLVAFLFLEGGEYSEAFDDAAAATVVFSVLYGAPPILLLLSTRRSWGPAPAASPSDSDEASPGRIEVAVLILLTLGLLAVFSTKAVLRPRSDTGADPAVLLRPYRYSREPGSSAIASLKTLVTAEEQYKSTGGGNVYVALTQLSAATPPYVDRVLGAGKKSGYCFSLFVGTPADSNWYATARPVVPGKTGNRFFFVDSSGVIRFALTGPASSADTPID